MDKIYITKIDSHFYEDYFVENIYVGFDLEAATKAAETYKPEHRHSCYAYVETWENGIRIENKE